MENLFRKNLTFLKESKAKTYADIGIVAGCSANTVSYWLNKDFEPKMIEVEKISQYFAIPIEKLLYEDLENVHLIKKKEDEKNQKNVHLNVHPSVHLNEKKLADYSILNTFENALEQALNEEHIPIETAQDQMKELAHKVAKLEAFISKLAKENEARGKPRPKRPAKK